MRVFPVYFLFVAFLLPFSVTAADILTLPDSIGSNPVLSRVEELKFWTPDNMYEQVNGEAELLKRYGALSLAYVTYEHDGGAYLSSEILDMGAPVNAFGLYRLYAGCDGDENSLSGATVLSGDFTSYAILGQHFMRIDVDVNDGLEGGKSLVDEFLLAISKELPASAPLPVVLERLKKMARKPCEVGYHPEHVDYDLESGPGYTWVGPDGGTYFVRILPSPVEAEGYAAALTIRGAQAVLVWTNVVTWAKTPTLQTPDYLREVAKTLVGQEK
jgi:hypothetical protein